jgi:HTH-type transcriptional regulator/antitoxin HigA
MTVKTKFRLKPAHQDAYLALVKAFPLSSIQSEEHLQEAQRAMDSLLAQGKLGRGEAMYLEALSDLVASYEDEYHAIEPSADAEMLRHLLEAKGITQAQLCRATQIPKSSISEILAGKKPFSRMLIRKLAGYFQVDASVLAANFHKKDTNGARRTPHGHREPAIRMDPKKPKHVNRRLTPGRLPPENSA